MTKICKRKRLYADAGPLDLTYDKIDTYMRTIKFGDIVDFPSVKACYYNWQLDRRNTFIRAKGVVVETGTRFVVVQLPKGTKECVGVFDIMKVNGTPNPHYIRGVFYEDSCKSRRPVSDAPAG